MGGAMLTGWLRGGVPAERFTVYDPFLASAPDGVELLRELPEGRVFDLMILGVKPQMLDGVAGALTALAGPDTVVLSMLAGVEMASLSLRLMRAGWCGSCPTLRLPWANRRSALPRWGWMRPRANA
jgi:pyrroline-5-carboxylate reductase